MAFTVRLFGHRGYKQIPMVLPQQFSANDQQKLWQPYEWRQAVLSDGATPVYSSPQPAPDLTKVLYVEIPSGSSIRYELIPPGSGRVPDANSPLMSASGEVAFEPGWTFGFIEG